MLDALDFTSSEERATFNFSWSKAFPMTMVMLIISTNISIKKEGMEHLS